MRHIVIVALLLAACDPNRPPTEYECTNVCEAQVRAAEKKCLQTVQQVKDTCVRQAPRMGQGSKQLSSRSYDHPEHGRDMLVETKVRVWKSKKPVKLQCFYYEGDCTDQYLRRTEMTIHVQTDEPEDVTVIDRIYNPPWRIRLGRTPIRTECAVLVLE